MRRDALASAAHYSTPRAAPCASGDGRVLGCGKDRPDENLTPRRDRRLCLCLRVQDGLVAGSLTPLSIASCERAQKTIATIAPPGAHIVCSDLPGLARTAQDPAWWPLPAPRSFLSLSPNPRRPSSWPSCGRRHSSLLSLRRRLDLLKRDDVDVVVAAADEAVGALAAGLALHALHHVDALAATLLGWEHPREA